MKKIFFTFIVFLVFAVDSWGAAIPQINHQGLIKSISESKGKVVLLNFWAVWCGPCRQEIPELIKIRDKFSEKQLAMYSVSVDYDVRMLNSFMDKADINYSVFHGTQDVSMVFGVRALPKLILYNKNGEKAINHEGLVSFSELDNAIQTLLAQ